MKSAREFKFKKKPTEKQMKETSSGITDTFYNVRCIICGKEIEQKDKWQTKAHIVRRFCSKKCYAKYRRIEKK